MTAQATAAVATETETETDETATAPDTSAPDVSIDPVLNITDPDAPQIGERVWFWRPHPTADIGVSKKPQFAIIADVQVNEETGAIESCTLSVLTHSGVWRQMIGAKYSAVPRVNRWTRRESGAE